MNIYYTGDDWDIIIDVTDPETGRPLDFSSATAVSVSIWSGESENADEDLGPVACTDTGNANFAAGRAEASFTAAQTTALTTYGVKYVRIKTTIDGKTKTRGAGQKIEVRKGTTS